MPNICVKVGSSATAFSLGSKATEKDADFVSAIFNYVVKCCQTLESQLDAVTGLSGSGPAYVFMMIEAMADGGVKMGLTRKQAQQLAAHTVYGAAKMVLKTNEHPASMKDAVTSPGGTTASGIHKLEELGFRNALMSAVEAGSLKSKSLSD